jgi:hypothetical protein
MTTILNTTNNVEMATKKAKKTKNKKMKLIINDAVTINEKRSIPINSLSKLKSPETTQQLDREVNKYISRK